MNLQATIRLLRPAHWVKNAFVFAALVFSVKFTDPHLVLLNLAGFACFCALASGVYVLNDIRDREADRIHPARRNRPIASGQIAVGQAAVVGLALLVAGLAAAIALNRSFGLVAAVYILINILYTLAVKEWMIADIMFVAIGFVLRAMAGAFLIEVPVSPWLIICTFCICLFMGFGKRRCELAQLAEDAASFRKVHETYTLTLLDHMIDVTSAIAVISFLLYTVSKQPAGMMGREYAPAELTSVEAWVGQPLPARGFLMYTVPLVMFCIFRFSALVQSGKISGPMEIITKDRPFVIGFLLWAAASLLLLYFTHRF